jgi:hypothetical protein
MPTPVNHPPIPVLESASPAIVQDEDCEAIKARFGIESDTHDGNSSKKSRSYQSHHVLQDHASQDLIGRGDALAVLLGDSHRATEHGDITKRQNNRRDNKRHGRGGTQPASTFGDLKKQAKEDLVAGLEGKRKDKNTDKPMTKEEAEKVADCLIAEAEEAIQDEMDENDMGELTDDTPVQQPGGCVAAGTEVWLAGDRRASAEAVREGLFLETPAGPLEVVRTDRCVHNLVEIEIDDWRVAIASYHRVRLCRGDYARADALRVGEQVETANGPSIVRSVRTDSTRAAVYSFGFGRKAICRIGRGGLWIEAPHTGVRVSRRMRLTPFRGLGNRAASAGPGNTNGGTPCPS